MKIKKFKNLWTMGLLLTGGALVTLYLIKLIFPNFIVGVAQLPSIVKIGTFVDSNIFLYYAFNFITSIIVAYFFCCASCRKKRLDYIDLIIVISLTIILNLLQVFLPLHYVYFNLLTMIACPCLICFKDKRIDIKYFYSTIICFSIHILAQILSLEIRGISTLISYPNSATYTILLIDVYICQFLLYNYFNFKENEQNG